MTKEETTVLTCPIVKSVAEGWASYHRDFFAGMPLDDAHARSVVDKFEQTFYCGALFTFAMMTHLGEHAVSAADISAKMAAINEELRAYFEARMPGVSKRPH